MATISAKIVLFSQHTVASSPFEPLPLSMLLPPGAQKFLSQVLIGRFVSCTTFASASFNIKRILVLSPKHSIRPLGLRRLRRYPCNFISSVRGHLVRGSGSRSCPSLALLVGSSSASLDRLALSVFNRSFRPPTAAATTPALHVGFRRILGSANRARPDWLRVVLALRNQVSPRSRPSAS